MIRLNWKSVLIGVAVVALLVGFAPQADAFWGRHGYSYYSCYSPCYSACYTPCYTPCYSSCYTPACGYGYGYGYGWSAYRRSFRRAYRWYPTAYYGYSYPSYTAVCCNGTTSVSPAAVSPTLAKPTLAAPEPASPAPITPVPVIPAAPVPPISAPAPAAPAPLPPGNTNVPMRANSGLVTVWVPFDAKVTVNGLPTQSQGTRRQFVSYGLKPGFTYKYVVRAEIARGGQLIVNTKTVVLTAGDRTALAFGFNALPAGSLAAK